MSANVYEEEGLEVSFLRDAKMQPLEHETIDDRCANCITAVIKELAQRTRCTSTTRLFAIDSVESLVAEEGEGHEEIAPKGDRLRVSRIVVEKDTHSDEIEA